jgi:RNA polymerase sigma factor (TIGR02999 family)
MRQILVDHARAKYRQRRARPPIEEIREAKELKQVIPVETEELLALDEALRSLASIDQMASRIVELRFFGGLSTQEIAEILSLSPSTVDRNWSYARSWLRRELKTGTP